MTLLDQIIEDATDDTASTANLLRKVIVVAHRLRAIEVETWARAELDGYDDIEALPKYRRSLATPVMGTWAGPGGARLPQVLGPGAIPADAKEVLFRAWLTQSLDELEQLSTLPEDPAVPWEPWQVMEFNKWTGQGLVPRIPYMSLLDAHRVVSKGVIRGVLGKVRTTALNFALELQMANPDAGSVGGPTVAETDIANTIFQVTNNIYGAGANVAQGSGIVQSSTVTAGDITGLLQAAHSAGLTDTAAARDLAAAASADETERESMFDRVVEKVKAGTYTVATGVTIGSVVGVLEEAIKAYLGLT